MLLDAHVSGGGVGRRLEAGGHDVLALDQHPHLEGLSDDDVLALAAETERILVTHNVTDFPRILREWAAAERSHAGVILVYGIDHSEFDLVARGVERWLTVNAAPARWTDFPAVLDRRFADLETG